MRDLKSLFDSPLKKVLALLLFIMNVVTSAKSQRISFSAGPEFSMPISSKISSNGYGGSVALGYFFLKKIEGYFTISYNHFGGDVVDHFKNDTITGFTVMPILPGIKFFVTDKFYLAGAMGIVVGIRNAGNHFALSPGAGLLIPVTRKSKIDLGIKLIAVPLGYSFSENNFLNKGGYSYLTMKAGYVF